MQAIPPACSFNLLFSIPEQRLFVEVHIRGLLISGIEWLGIPTACQERQIKHKKHLLLSLPFIRHTFSAYRFHQPHYRRTAALLLHCRL